MSNLDRHPLLKADVDDHLEANPHHAVTEELNLYGDLTAVGCSCGERFTLGQWGPAFSGGEG